MVEEIYLLLNPTGLEVTRIPSTHIPVVRISHLSARRAEKHHPSLAATIQLCTKTEEQHKPWWAVNHLCHLPFKDKESESQSDELTHGRAVCLW